MTKSELIDKIFSRQQTLTAKDVELAVQTVLEHIAEALEQGERVEVRGFGSFSLHHRAPRVGRNPRTGEAIDLPSKQVPHFKPGKLLRNRVNQAERLRVERFGNHSARWASSRDGSGSGSD